MKYEVTILGGLPDGVELDPFGGKNSGFVITSRGNVYASKVALPGHYIGVAPKTGYEITGGIVGPAKVEKIPVEQEVVTIKFVKPKNYIGLEGITYINDNFGTIFLADGRDAIKVSVDKEVF
jgi:hypothetical protein